ncbi:MAG: hypothetical protein ACRBCI_11735 [Cellvibrionaceae bacterium]
MQITGEQVFLIFFGACLFSILWLPITWVLLSVFTPKRLLEKYFKEPHFTQTETVMMREFPGFLLRTGIFGWLLLFPKLDNKRKIKDIDKHIPRWYNFFLKFFIIIDIAILLILFTSGFFLEFQ